MIPKIIHIIWIGDDSIRPDNCIQTWIDMNPSWCIKIWGNEDLKTYGWHNAHHMKSMFSKEINGVADMMRWEILYNEGGLLVDADSSCCAPLDEWLLDLEAFACWENEICRPGLIAAGYVGTVPENPFFGQIIQDIKSEPSVISDMAWKTVGPLRLTQSHKKYSYTNLTILPSHFFIPEHFSGIKYTGTGKVYAQQYWGSTKKIYQELNKEQLPTGRDGGPIDSSSAPAPAPAPAARKNYFHQTIELGKELLGRSRLDVFTQICSGKNVLHIGCADWPITDIKQNLHIQLDKVCNSLDGFDINTESFSTLQEHIRGELFSDLTQIKKQYDIVLIPEVIEHVPNIQIFLEQIHQIDARNFIITAPDAFQCKDRHFAYDSTSEQFTEIIHPDHNCWFSAYTLKNTIKKYTPWKIHGLWLFNNISIMLIAEK